MGLAFQVPVGVLALTRTGVVTARTLWVRQGYVILGISVVAAVVTPTPDPVTMLVTMAPLVLLYELSIGLVLDLPPARRLDPQPLGRGVGSRRGLWSDDDDDGRRRRRPRRRRRADGWRRGRARPRILTGCCSTCAARAAAAPSR